MRGKVARVRIEGEVNRENMGIWALMRYSDACLLLLFEEYYVLVSVQVDNWLRKLESYFKMDSCTIILFENIVLYTNILL